MKIEKIDKIKDSTCRNIIKHLNNTLICDNCKKPTQRLTELAVNSIVNYILSLQIVGGCIVEDYNKDDYNVD